MRSAIRRSIGSRPPATVTRFARAVTAVVTVTLVIGGTSAAVAYADPTEQGPAVTSDVIVPTADPTATADPTDSPVIGDATAPTRAELKAAKKAAKKAARQAALKLSKQQARAAAKNARAAQKDARTAGKAAANAGARVAARTGQASISAADSAKARAATIRSLIQDGASATKLDKAADKARAAAKSATKAAKAAKKVTKKIARRLAKCSPQARACVDLTTDMAWLQSGGKVVYGPVPITAGRQGHVTRVGTWSVYYKDKDHKSREFDGAPMPYSVFFDSVGIAFHVGSLSVASHGCIHLSWAAGVKFFEFLGYGDTVQVFGKSPYAPGQVYV